ncbi:MAG: hypothetical protein QXS76_00005, partial [Candidatus Bathyarchaeia archaeon]
AEAEEEKALAMDAATRPSLETSALPTIPRARTAIRTGDLFYYVAAAAIMAFAGNIFLRPYLLDYGPHAPAIAGAILGAALFHAYKQYYLKRR